jgi:hypothetical protein
MQFILANEEIEIVEKIKSNFINLFVIVLNMLVYLFDNFPIKFNREVLLLGNSINKSNNKLTNNIKNLIFLMQDNNKDSNSNEILDSNMDIDADSNIDQNIDSNMDEDAYSDLNNDSETDSDDEEVNFNLFEPDAEEQLLYSKSRDAIVDNTITDKDIEKVIEKKNWSELTDTDIIQAELKKVNHSLSDLRRDHKVTIKDLQEIESEKESEKSNCDKKRKAEDDNDEDNDYYINQKKNVLKKLEKEEKSLKTQQIALRSIKKRKF